MSGLCEAWAWTVRDVKNTAKFVLVFLARKAYYDDGRGAWPSLATIGEHCGCDTRTVRRALESLQSMGYIEPGDQHFSARDPKTGRMIGAGHRSMVWNVVMKDVDVQPEDIEEHPEPDDEHAVCDKMSTHNHPGNPAHEDDRTDPVVSKSSEEPVKARQGTIHKPFDGIAVSPPDGSNSDADGVDRVGCDKMSTHIGSDKMSRKSDKMSTNRLITNNNPSTPTGYPPKVGNPPEDDSKPVDADDGSRGRELCLAIVAGMRRAPRLPVPLQLDDGHGGISKRELDAALQLVESYGLERCLTVSRWALRPETGTSRPGGFSWRSVVTGPRKLAQKWDKIVAQMANDPTGISMLARLGETPVEQHRALPVSSEHRVRVPVYGARKFGTAAAQGHLEGEIPAAGCPLCIFDERNRATHGDPVSLDSPAPSTPQPRQETPVDPTTGRVLSRFKGSKDYVGDAWMREHTQSSAGTEAGDRDE
jgi:hypothetical protein